MAEIEMPDDEAIDAMARAIHQRYLDARCSSGTVDEAHPAMKQWDQLSPELRGQNRDQARDNILKLASQGFRVVRAESGDPSGGALTDEQIEGLARAEHDRWAAQKRAQGYRFGEVRVDDGPDKRHPDLVAWEDLSESDRDKDREPVRQMIAVLDEAGFAAVSVVP